MICDVVDSQVTQQLLLAVRDRIHRSASAILARSNQAKLTDIMCHSIWPGAHLKFVSAGYQLVYAKCLQKLYPTLSCSLLHGTEVLQLALLSPAAWQTISWHPSMPASYTLSRNASCDCVKQLQTSYDKVQSFVCM